MKRLITPENNVKLALELRRGRWLVHDISTLIPTAISLLQQQDILLQAAEREFDIMLYDVDARAVSANPVRIFKFSSFIQCYFQRTPGLM